MMKLQASLCSNWSDLYIKIITLTEYFSFILIFQARVLQICVQMQAYASQLNPCLNILAFFADIVKNNL